MATTQQRTTTEHVAPVGVAHRLEAALRPFVGGDLPVRLRAWDGSEAGPAGRSAGRAAVAGRRTPTAVAPG